MTLDEIKSWMDENRENPDVAKYIDSLADRRVNTALEKAKAKHEADLEEKVQARIQEREEKTAQLNARENRLDEAFSCLDGRYRGIGSEMMGDLGQYADDAAFESKLSTVSKMVLEAVGSQPAPKGGSSTQSNEVSEFRAAMGLKT